MSPSTPTITHSVPIPPPPTGSRTPPDRHTLNTILSDLLSTNQPLPDIAAAHGLTFRELAALLGTPEAEAVFADLRRIADLRREHFLAQAQSAAIRTLQRLAAESENEETARRAAATLLRAGPSAPKPLQLSDNAPAHPPHSPAPSTAHPHPPRTHAPHRARPPERAHHHAPFAPPHESEDTSTRASAEVPASTEARTRSASQSSAEIHPPPGAAASEARASTPTPPRADDARPP